MNRTVTGACRWGRFCLVRNKPFTPMSDKFKISHALKNLGFHSLLRWKMIILPILTTSLIHFSKDGRMYFLNLGVKAISIVIDSNSVITMVTIEATQPSLLCRLNRCALQLPGRFVLLVRRECGYVQRVALGGAPLGHGLRHHVP